MTNQSKIVKRIESICAEADHRFDAVGWLVARLEMAKALAESENEAHELRSKLYAARAAIERLKDYRRRNPFNFQLEKWDSYVAAVDAALGASPDEQERQP